MKQPGGKALQGLTNKILDRLKQSPYWNRHTRCNGNSIQGLTCPACGDKSAWAYQQSPMAINCNRLSNCGTSTKTLELFPELKGNVEKDFPATKNDPHKPAREYLKSRGINKTLDGLDFRYLKNVRNTGSGAVMFPIGKDSKGKEILNGRLFSPPPGEGKTHNINSPKSIFYRHPGFTYDPEKKVWAVEGIIDAISLIELGYQAIAVISSGQDPHKVDLSEFKNKVLAFDNDPAGHRACAKWSAVYPEAEVYLCDPGKDWNDLLASSSSLEDARKYFQRSLPRFKHNGELALAKTSTEWAEIYNEFYHRAPGLFNFQGSTYYSALKKQKGNDTPFLDVERCLRATVRVNSYLINKANPAQPEYLYNLIVQPPKGKQIEVTATGTNLVNSRSINEFFLSRAKINWEGNPRAATAFQTKITSDQSAPEVCQAQVIGYQPENDSYIFHDWGVGPEGKLFLPDKRGHFRIAYNQSYRPPVHGAGKAISPATINKSQVKEIYTLLHDAWGLNGISAFSLVLSSFFVNQIKAECNFFPFLSLHGDPASGKSALVTLLNAIQGRDGEGLPVTQLNSKKGSIRTIGQLSGLFTALLEDNERNERGFDYSIILTAYNRGPLQVQATFSADLQTKENPFLGALLFCQNTEPFNSKAERQRVISLHFKAEDLTDNSRVAYEKLTNMDKPILAGLIQNVLMNRKHFESNWTEEWKKARTDLSPMPERRILDNHALILAFHRLFCSLYSIKQDQAVTDYFRDICRQKCITSAIRQTTTADYFFELLDTLPDDKAATAYHLDSEKNRILVNLPRVENLLKNKGLNFQVNEQLAKALQAHPSYVKNSYAYRFPDDPETDKSGRPKQRRVWVFDLKWHQNNLGTPDEATEPDPGDSGYTEKKSW